MNDWKERTQKIRERLGGMQKNYPNIEYVKELTGPPCSDCVNWKPMLKSGFSYGEVHNGLTLCHSKERYQDFSCFQNIPVEVKIADGDSPF